MSWMIKNLTGCHSIKGEGKVSTLKLTPASEPCQSLFRSIMVTFSIITQLLLLFAVTRVTAKRIHYCQGSARATIVHIYVQYIKIFTNEGISSESRPAVHHECPRSHEAFNPLYNILLM